MSCMEIPWEKAGRENNFGELRANFRAHDVLTFTEGNITACEGHLSIYTLIHSAETEMHPHHKATALSPKPSVRFHLQARTTLTSSSTRATEN